MVPLRWVDGLTSLVEILLIAPGDAIFPWLHFLWCNFYGLYLVKFAILVSFLIFQGKYLFAVCPKVFIFGLKVWSKPFVPCLNPGCLSLDRSFRLLQLFKVWRTMESEA